MENLLQYLDGFTFYLSLIVACWLAVFVACLLDLWDGIRTAKAVGERVKSGKMRKTIEKFGDYWRPLAMFLLADVILFTFSWYEAPFATIIITLAELVIEFRSIWEHSKKRKDKLQQLPDIIAGIIKATTAKDARTMLTQINDYINTKEIRGDIQDENK